MKAYTIFNFSTLEDTRWPTIQGLHASLWLHYTTISNHFKETVLITNSEGLKIIQLLQIPYTEIYTYLDEAPQGYPWNYYKMYGLNLISGDFFYCDIDCYLYQNLNEIDTIPSTLIQSVEFDMPLNTASIKKLSKLLGTNPYTNTVTDRVYNTGVLRITGLNLYIFRLYLKFYFLCVHSLIESRESLEMIDYVNLEQYLFYKVFDYHKIPVLLLIHRTFEFPEYYKIGKNELKCPYPPSDFGLSKIQGGIVHLQGTMKDLPIVEESVISELKILNFKAYQIVLNS